MTPDRLIRLGILFFWGAYFTLVFASNGADALKAMGVLSESFAFASGNYALVHRVTRIYAVPAAGVALLFAGVLLWQVTVATLYWKALAGWLRDRGEAREVNLAFAGALGLWAAFILMDEFLIAYDVAGLESTHVALLSAQLLSLLVFHSKLGRRREGRGQAHR
jgi:hypothetical protein